MSAGRAFGHLSQLGLQRELKTLGEMGADIENRPHERTEAGLSRPYRDFAASARAVFQGHMKSPIGQERTQFTSSDVVYDGV